MLFIGPTRNYDPAIYSSSVVVSWLHVSTTDVTHAAKSMLILMLSKAAVRGEPKGGEKHAPQPPAVQFIQYHKVSRSTSCYQVRAPQARCRKQTPVLFGNEDKVRATEMMVLLTLTRWTTKKHVINNASEPSGSLGLGKFHPDIGTAHQFFHTPVFHAPTKKRPAARSKIQYAVSLLHNVAFPSFW